MSQVLKRDGGYNKRARTNRRPSKPKNGDGAAAVLSAELQQDLRSRNQYVDEEDGASGAKQQDKYADEAPRRGVLSKREVKRLRKVLEQKQKKQQRVTLLAKLQEHTLNADRAGLLASTSTISHRKPTAKQRMRAELKQTRAGIASLEPEAASGRDRLIVHHQPAAEVEESSSESEGEAPMEDSESSSGEEDQQGDESTFSSLSATDFRRESEHTGPSAQELLRRPRVQPSAPAVHVHVQRTPEVQAVRLALPIIKEEARILEAIKAHNVVIICGETGSGKTTQIPQFLYEAGRTTTSYGEPGLVGVTEPRRLAATNMAKRVGVELNMPEIVSHQVRYDSNVTDDTLIKFMTDGVLQKEIEGDFALRKYTTIVVDEAHERSMHTDILLGLLSRIVPLRQQMHEDAKKNGKPPVDPLKLIIMSATLRVKDFTENPRLFPGVDIPVLSVEARQFPVTVHFSRRTRVDQDPVAQVVRKVSQIHTRLPGGGILVFMTGQGEILDVCRRLREEFPKKANEAIRSSPASKRKTTSTRRKGGQAAASVNEGAGGSGSIEQPDIDKEETETTGQLTESESEDEQGEELKSEVALRRSANVSSAGGEDTVAPLHVLPLYSNLHPSEQAKVFDPPPPGCRLCVVATNVAETSLTIPGMRYVVDTGLCKTMRHEATSGVSAFVVEWTSKASAKQRAGRAGRTGPGHCYRLYSSAIYENDFAEFSDPEILRMPVDGLMLQMKAMDIDKVINFPFPTPPDSDALRAAEKLLVHLNALSKVDKRITAVGKAMAQFPVAPRYGKMLSLASHYKCLDAVAAVVAALTVKDLFTFNVSDSETLEVEEGQAAAPPPTDGPRQAMRKARETWTTHGVNGGSDLAALLSAIGATDHESASKRSVDKFCRKMGLRYKAVVESHKLRRQLLTRDRDVWGDGLAESVETTPGPPALAPLSPSQLDVIRQIVLAAFGDRVARVVSATTGVGVDGQYAQYETDAVSEPVYIHPHSVLKGARPEFVVYHELFQGKTKLYMKGVTMVDAKWLPRLATNLCVFSKPLENPPPFYDAERDDVRCCMTAAFGQHLWQLPASIVSFPQSPDRYKFFARFLLEGEILPKLQQFTPHLKNKPAVFNKPWVKALVDAEVDTLAKLRRKWEADPKSYFVVA